MPVMRYWSDEEVTNLLNYVEKYGRAEGVVKFSEEFGRTIDAARHKLSRVESDDDEFADAEETVNDADFEPIDDPKYSSDEETHISLFKKIYNWILMR